MTLATRDWKSARVARFLGPLDDGGLGIGQGGASGGRDHADLLRRSAR